MKVFFAMINFGLAALNAGLAAKSIMLGSGFAWVSVTAAVFGFCLALVILMI